MRPADAASALLDAALHDKDAAYDYYYLDAVAREGPEAPRADARVDETVADALGADDAPPPPATTAWTECDGYGARDAADAADDDDDDDDDDSNAEGAAGNDYPDDEEAPCDDDDDGAAAAPPVAPDWAADYPACTADAPSDDDDWDDEITPDYYRMHPEGDPLDLSLPADPAPDY